MAESSALIEKRAYPILESLESSTAIATVPRLLHQGLNLGVLRSEMGLMQS